MFSFSVSVPMRRPCGPDLSLPVLCAIPQKALRIAMVGKYNGLSDAYLSVIKALQHACLKCKSKLQVGAVFYIVTGEPFKQSAELIGEPIKMKGEMEHWAGVADKP